MSDGADAAPRARGTESWTVRRMAKWMADDFTGRGIESARLDAELLVAHALGCKRIDLYLDLDRPMSRDELSRVRALVQRRRAHEPVAYLIGQREFWGLRIEVSSAVLVPRPETELLVERGLLALPEVGGRALDLCTGSGAVALALATERAEARVDATDASPEALAVARGNVAQHGLAERIALHEGDLFDALPEPRRYDLITANPPYVTQGEWGDLPPDVRDHEPQLALVAGPEGTEVLTRIVDAARDWLTETGVLLLEVGETQAPDVETRCRDAGFASVASHEDLRGVARVVAAHVAAPARSD